MFLVLSYKIIEAYFVKRSLHNKRHLWKTHTTFNGERLDAFPLRSATKQGHSFLPLLHNDILVLDSSIKGNQQENKRHAWGKEIVKLYLFTDDMILDI